MALNSFSMKIFRKVISNITKRNISIYSFNLNNKPIESLNSNDSTINSSKQQQQQEEADWFKNLTETSRRNSDEVDDKELKLNLGKSSKFNIFSMSEMNSNSIFANVNKEKKRKMIQELLISLRAQNFSIPSEFSEDEWQQLDTSQSLTHLKTVLKRVTKERYYKLLKEKRRIQVAQIREEKLKRTVDDLEEGEFLTNYPGNSSFLKRVTSINERIFYRHKVLTSIRTNAPSIIFDFRYESSHEKDHLYASLYRQYIHIIKLNRTAPEPFQLHFCNYDENGIFNKKYGKLLDFDDNLIFNTSKSYLDVFPREQLVYLSKDSRSTMTEFDPNKTYIIGSLIDTNYNLSRFASYSQAKRDGIACQRLPLDENVRWYSGKKDLAMNHVFEILCKLYNRTSWEDTLKTTLPKRFISDRYTR